MLNITLTHYETYSENPQPNPLRWRIMYKNEDGSFVDQAAVMKCKDFFNDVVAKVSGNVNFIKYGFNNSTIKSNEGGIYLLLTGVDCPKTIFLRNIETVVNPKLKEDLGCEVSLEIEKEKVMVLIPSKVWASTYYISLLSLLIRGCNYGVVVNSWEYLLGTIYTREGAEHNPTGSGYLRPSHMDVLNRVGFRMPMAEKYWFYSGSYNSENSLNAYALGSLVHDNGVVSWIMSGVGK